MQSYANRPRCNRLKRIIALHKFKRDSIKKLVKRLNETCETLDKNYNTNWGGCCYVAYVLAEKLSELKIDYEVGIDGVFNIDESNNITIVFISHIAIRVNNKYIINDMPNSSLSYDWYNLRSDQLWDMYVKGDWNTHYDPCYNTIVKNEILNL